MKKTFFSSHFHSLSSLLGAISLVVLSSCEKLPLRPEAAGPSVSASATQLAKAKGENPFTVAIMQRAYANLIAKRAAGQAASLKKSTATGSSTTANEVPIDCLECPDPNPVPPPYPTPTPTPTPTPAPIQPTHLYLRFKPADINQLADLGDLGFNLSWEPMDESVAAATTVNYQSDEIPWIYTVVPVGTPLPAGIQSEQIAQLFLFNEEDGDAQDNDPWLPSPDPGPAPCTPQWDPSCQCYHDCPVLQLAATTSAQRGKTKAHKPSKQAEVTAKLKQAGISPKALYNEAMRLSGHEDETAPEAGQTTSATAQLSLFGGRYHPSGKIQVQDTELGTAPLRGVEVKSRRWFQFGNAFTDNQGNFAISTSYHNLAKLSLNFKNDLATTRGIVDGIKVWTAVLPISAEIGSYEDGDMENVNYVISYIGQPGNLKSKGASVFEAATLFNILAEDRDLSISRNIPTPVTAMNVWLLPDFPTGTTDGSTPMLRTIANTAIASQVADFLLIASGLAELDLIKQILQRQLPDVCIRYGGDQGALSSHRMRSLLYHELGHTQHYKMMGNNFWTTYISDILQHGGYGGRFDNTAGLMAVSEGWGNYIGRTLVNDKYQGSTASVWGRFAVAELENQTPDNSTPLRTTMAPNGDPATQGWLASGIMHDMTDNVEPTFTGVTDNVNAFSTMQVYRGLQNGSYSVRSYQACINNQNSGLQAAQMEQLVTSYGW